MIHLAEENSSKPVYILSRPLNTIITDAVQAWMDIFDDLMAGKYKEKGINILLLDNKLFYVGITLAFFSFLLIIYNIIVHYSYSSNNCNNCCNCKK